MEPTTSSREVQSACVYDATTAIRRQSKVRAGKKRPRDTLTALYRMYHLEGIPIMVIRVYPSDLTDVEWQCSLTYFRLQSHKADPAPWRSGTSSTATLLYSGAAVSGSLSPLFFRLRGH